MGTSFPTVVPYRVYQASDREVAIAVGSERLWAIFCATIGRPELEKHPDYRTNALRIANRESLEPMLESVFSTRSAGEWVELLQGAGVPSSLVRSFGEVEKHAQSDVRKMFPVLNHPVAGAHKVTGTPVKLSDTPGRPNLPAPLLGQHTRSVLKEAFELNDASIDDLIARGIVFESPEGA
jgi:crotonobetainyl-CoA:carnitine CoA-transferase CaiB-like acyl-CoA transferase